MVSPSHTPLAERMRPQRFEQIVGQDHLLKDNGWIKKSIETGRPLSILLWGPPGCGKTTFARLYARAFEGHLLSFSGVTHGSKDLKEAIEKRKKTPLFSRRLIIFIDEIHRFNKAQQDTLLPYVEDGTMTLIGATTENPSFSLNNSLLSRLRTLTLNPLSEGALALLLDRFETPLPLTQKARGALIHMASGDARHLINMVENLSHAPSSPLLEPEDLAHWVQKRPPLYDKSDEGHYNFISALHKSVRGSDPQATLYWLARMLSGGEDPYFIARRLIRMASEDIGLADPSALSLTLDASKAYEQLGSPEGELALAQAALYLALAPKSNATYLAFKKAMQRAKETGEKDPPKIILNAPTSFMKGQGYGDGYRYDHNEPYAFSGQNYFPDGMERPTFYSPVPRGFEREMQKRLDYFMNLRKKMPSR